MRHATIWGDARRGAVAIALLALSCAAACATPAGTVDEIAPPPHSIRIAIASIPVDDQGRARAFYTEKLGFTVHRDLPLGEYSWLTVVSPAGVEGAELLLEPNAHPAVKALQAALRADGIPVTVFPVGDIAAEYERLLALGVTFRMPPTRMGASTNALFDDTVGNWIMLAEEHATETPE